MNCKSLDEYKNPILIYASFKQLNNENLKRAYVGLRAMCRRFFGSSLNSQSSFAIEICLFQIISFLKRAYVQKGRKN